MKNRGIFSGSIAALAWCLLTTPALSRQADIYVPADYETIQEAVDAAVDGDVISVSSGIYKGTGDSVVDLKGKQLQLIGAGAAGTYILGEYVRRGIVCTAPNESSAKDSNFTTRVSGFSITTCVGFPDDINGDGTIDSDETAGGGIYVDGVDAEIWLCRFFGNNAAAGGGLFVRNSDASILGCNFTANDGGLGAGAYIESSDANILSCTFSENEATQSGGGCYLKNSDGLRINNSSFELNTAGISGGGLYLENAMLPYAFSLDETHFTGNIAFGDPGEPSPGGGGAWFLSAGSVLNARNCDLVENSGYEGGAVQSKDSSISLDDCSISYSAAFGGSGGGFALSNTDLTLVSCKTIANDAEAGSGGAIQAVSGSNIEISGGGVEGNTATNHGGAIFLSDSSLAFSDSRVNYNVSGTEGGAIYATSDAGAQLVNVEIRGNSAVLGGGGLTLDADARVTLTTCTLSSNNCNDGSGGAVAIELPSKLTSNQSIFWDNEALDGGAIFNTGTFAPHDSVFCSNVPNHIDGPWTSTGGNCFSFVCQDSSGDHVPDSCICESDLDGDGQVNGSDLSLLLGDWATSGPSGDIDGSGFVEGADLALMLGAWGGCFNE